MPTLQPAAKPRFRLLAITCTSGNRCRMSSAELSLEPLSTTVMLYSTSDIASKLWIQSMVMSRPFQFSTTIHTRGFDRTEVGWSLTWAFETAQVPRSRVFFKALQHQMPPIDSWRKRMCIKMRGDSGDWHPQSYSLAE